MRPTPTRIASLATLLVASTAVCRADTFIGLGPVGGAVTGLIGESQSGNSSLTVGTIYTSTNQFPITWHQPSTIGTQLPLGGYKGGGSLGTSQTGAYTVGYILDSSAHVGPALWTNGIFSLLPFPSGVTQAQAVAVSGTGQIIVGSSVAGTLKPPFYWTGGKAYTVSLPSGASAGQFLNVSSDATSLVGTVLQGSTQYAAQYSFTTSSWTQAAPISGKTVARFLATSSNGGVSVGDCTTLTSQGALTANQAVRFANGGLVSLGAPSTSLPRSILHAVSADGFTAVGSAFSGTEQDSSSTAMIWDGDHGWRQLKAVLVADGVSTLSNWRLVAAYGLSADGQTITGLGVNPNGSYQAFLATVPYTVGANLTKFSMSSTSVVGGGAAVGMLTLSKAAPSGGLTVALASSSTLAKVPATIAVSGGSATASFSIPTTTVTASTTVTLSAGYKAVVLSTPLTLVPAGIASVTVSPVQIYSGQNTIYTVNLNKAAPTGGAAVKVQVGTLGSFTITVPVGKTTASLSSSLAESATNATVPITASYGGSTASTTLSVLACVISSISVSPASVKGGNSIQLTVTLLGFAPPSGLSVVLKSSSTKVTLTSPLTFAHGTNSRVVTQATGSVSSNTSATITATVNGSSKSCTLSILR